MKPLTLRTKLTLFYALTVSILLTGFGLIYYRLLSHDLDRDLTQDVLDRTSGLRGYLRFEEGLPIFAYDPNDPDEVNFINTATRYYQVYETRTGMLLSQSDEFRASGILFSPADVANYAQTSPSFVDLHTDQGKIRLRYEVVSAGGETYLLSVGASTQRVDDTINTFLKGLAWLIPTKVLLATVSS